MLTAIVDAHEGRDVMSADIPNAFSQTKLPTTKKGDERVIMKITGVLVDLLVDISPEVYGPYVVTDKHKRVLYVQVRTVWHAGGRSTVVHRLQEGP